MLLPFIYVVRVGILFLWLSSFWFAMIFVSGLQSLFREKLDGRNALIVALAIGIGVGIGNVPEALAQLPTWISNIFAQNGIIMTFVIATILNLILPKNKEKVEAVSA